MAHSKVYGFCDAKCKVEVAPKTEVDGKVSKSGDKMTGLLDMPELQITSTSGQWRFRPSGTGGPVLSIFKNNDSSLQFIGMSLSSNEVRLGCNSIRALNMYPIPSVDSTSNIATTAWVNKIDNDVVHKSRAEEISGAKTFTSNITISADGERGTLIYRNANIGVAWRRYKWDRCFGVFTDSSGNTSNQVVGQNLVINDATATTHQIIANNYKADGTQITATISLYAYSDGTTYAKVPTTPSDATSNEIATAGWVNNKLAGKSDTSHTHSDYATKTELAEKNKMTEFSSWAELEALIKAGKRGDSFNITMDFSLTGILGGADINGDNSEVVDTHGFGHFFIDEITVTDGAVTKLEAFGSGEVSGKFDGSTSAVYGVTGFGCMNVISVVQWAFRVTESGSLNYMVFNPSTTAPTSCTGYYISI